jgi:hypothetical protein
VSLKIRTSKLIWRKSNGGIGIMILQIDGRESMFIRIERIMSLQISLSSTGNTIR